jgi:hypothetical protein
MDKRLSAPMLKIDFTVFGNVELASRKRGLKPIDRRIATGLFDYANERNNRGTHGYDSLLLSDICNESQYQWFVPERFGGAFDPNSVCPQKMFCEGIHIRWNRVNEVGRRNAALLPSVNAGSWLAVNADYNSMGSCFVAKVHKTIENTVGYSAFTQNQSGTFDRSDEIFCLRLLSHTRRDNKK